ncbi:hypothetical protein [Streptomyces sp. NPDC005438]|uniref:hypothetical protein n=1 Tax=Streptomyces sp. NPDC005438 TaxID=3156880 RepID=UPI0033A859BD
MTHRTTGRGLRRGVYGLAGALLVLGALSTSAHAGDPTLRPGTGHGSPTGAGAQPRCEVPPQHDPAVIRTVHSVAVDQEVNDKVLLATFEAGWVSSHMNNLDCGDTLGVFQQSPGEVWGTPEQCLDPVHATTRFLEHAVAVDQAQPDLTAGELAQSVQRSAYPDRYDQAEGKARELITEAEAG